MHDLVTSCIISLFRKYWFTVLCRSLKCRHISFMQYFLKSNLLLSAPISSEKFFSIGKPSSSQWQVKVFQTTFLTFSECVCQSSKSLKPLRVSQSSFLVKVIFYGKKAVGAPCNSVTPVIDFDFLDFPQDKGCAWVYSINALCILPISSQSVKRCTHGSRINKNQLFYCFIYNIIK